jgi:hypothetical protein
MAVVTDKPAIIHRPAQALRLSSRMALIASLVELALYKGIDHRLVGPWV